MSRAVAVVVLMLSASLGAGCASGPRFATEGVDRALTPAQVTARGTAPDARVLWGGTVVSSRNLADRTQLEVLAYPLDRNDRPDRDKQPLGRFLIEKHGYLETRDYAEGRQLTVLGTLDGLRPGKVGEASYQYPVVRPDQLHLWETATAQPEPRFHFGLGVIIH